LGHPFGTGDDTQGMHDVARIIRLKRFGHKDRKRFVSGQILSRIIGSQFDSRF